MSDTGSLEALQALHRDLVAVSEHRFESIDALSQALDAHVARFGSFLDKPARSAASREAVNTGKVKVGDEEYSINKEFQEIALQLADELDLDEVQAAKLLLESQEDQITLGRSLLECGVIRFHQQRVYLLDCMRLCLQLSNDEDIEDGLQDGFGQYATAHIFGAGLPGQPAPSTERKIVPRSMAAMQGIRAWLQKLSDRVTTASVVYQANAARPPEIQETIEYSRVSLAQQHELLAFIVCAAIDKRHAEVKDFQGFLQLLKKLDRYDHLLVHLFPVLGAYINMFGSTEGVGDLQQARTLNKIICKGPDDELWTLPYLHAAARAWWIIEYSGWYLDDGPGGAALEGIDIDQEDRERSKQFTEALKEGAFDFILSVAADVKTPEWQDPARLGIRQWLQRKSPSLSSDSNTQFADFFQKCFMTQLEVFVEGFISNLPDVLRKLRIEEDEQRQLSQSHEQDLDLERFLLIIAYAYEGRPEAAEAFWADPDSNLAGFMQWASRRASTPLVSAFCEMLISLSEDSDSATNAHEFLMDEGQHSSGKMRKTLSLTWNQIFKELLFFSNKIRERPTPPQSHLYRGGKPTSEQAETEPESAMMLECYLRLITKLSSQSDTAKEFLLRNADFNLTEVLFQLASSSVPARLRACAFYALRALMARKSAEQGHVMWKLLDNYMTGHYYVPQTQGRLPMTTQHQSPATFIQEIFNEIAVGFEEPNAFIQFLLSLVTPVDVSDPLNGTLPFPEDLGSSFRMPGIDPYVDYVMGHVFSVRSKDLQDATQLRMLRLSCLQFALLCLETFNEDLIIIGNETNIAVDTVISTTDLATYVKLHPFARVMEWMFNDRVMDALFSTIHQDAAEIGSATPDSPLIMGILRAVEVLTLVLDLQNTYLDLVRPLIKLHARHRREPVANAVHASFEDGIMNHLNLVVDLGRYCGLGHPSLTQACLKLLERVSASSTIAVAWNPGPGRPAHRNKAIVALEADGESESIAGSFIAELIAPLDLAREGDSPNYMTKIYILDFLFACLRATPDQPTIAHLLLGFKCGLNTLFVEPEGDFDSRTSLFHNVLRVLLETPFGDDNGMRQWMVSLKYKIMRVLQILWSSPLSSSIVLSELRDLDFLFALLLREVTIQPTLPWDGQILSGPEFLLADGSEAFISFLALRSITFQYVGIELCSVSQNRLPNLKRRIFDALNGQTKADDGESMSVPSVFDLFDFLPSEAQWDVPPPEFVFYRDLDLRTCLEEDADSNPVYNVDKVKEILLLKRNETRDSGMVVSQQDASTVDKEEALLLEYLTFSNRQKQMSSYKLSVLRSWTNLLLVMFEANEFKGSARVSFLLQALQAILPSLESYSSESPDEAYELAKLAKVLLFKMDFAAAPSDGQDRHAVGNLVSDKLFQLFQICLHAIGKWAGSSELRAIYYSICYRYLTGIVDRGEGFLQGRHKTLKSIHLYGERLFNVVSDDAYGGDPACQTAALILLGAFVNLGRAEEDTHVVEMLNKLNFIGVLVDSLKSVLQDWLDVIRTDDIDQHNYWVAKLSLLLQLCQTRDGAKFVLQANLFRAIELSGLFAADPELEIDPTNTAALEKHYGLLVRVARVVGAAILSRGSHNVLQGQRFLADHRMLVMHVLKRSAGISSGRLSRGLEERVGDLADAFMVLITATDFMDFEEQQVPLEKKRTPVLFH